MSRRHALILALAALAVLTVIGCTERPAEPVFENPLDPLGPNAGDPFHINASYLSGKVYVSWTKLESETVAGYTILHAAAAGGPYALAGTVGPTVGSYFHTAFLPNAANFYMVRATDAEGRGTAVSSVAEARIVPPPTLVIGDTTFVRVPEVTLTIRSAIGDFAQLDSLPDFGSDLPLIALPDTLDENDLKTILQPWTFGPAAANATWLHLYLRVKTGTEFSAVEHDSVKVNFTPGFRLLGGAATVASRRPTLELLGEGIAEMRFALSEAALADSAFRDYAATSEGPELGAELAAQTIFGEFRSGFGFSDTTSIILQPDALLTVAPKFNGGKVSTSDSLVTVTAAVGATQMRFGLDGFVGGAPLWLDYTPSHAYRLEDPCGDGPQFIVSAQYRNDWAVSEILSDTITWIQPDLLQVFFDVPDTLYGGLSRTLQGSATSATCGDALTAVEIDTGGGWLAATGLAAWSLVWNVPAVGADSTATIRGLAIAGTDSTITLKTVVIRP